MKPYNTLKNEAVAEITEKRSRFIAAVKPVTSEEEATSFLESIRSQHYSAKHNVYAYILKNGKIKYSDDAEPQGTAGMPILEMLQKKELTDCIVVVTRYFGGVLLGTGGLVRAYTLTAQKALEKAETVTMSPFTACMLSCDYSSYGRMPALAEATGGKINNAVFGDMVNIEFYIPKDNVNMFRKELTEMSSGTLSPIIGDTFYISE